MPGRLLSSFVRTSPPPSRVLTNSTTSTSSVNDIPSSTKPNFENHFTSERRLSFSMDHLIRPHRDHVYKDKLLNLGRPGRSKEGDNNKGDVPPPTKLTIITESPPLVFYGTPTNSTGALFSGRLRVTVPETPGEITLNKLDIVLTFCITNKKPISRGCPDCAVRTEELRRWDFLTEPIRLKHGDHDFPFSYLFPGKLPASAQGVLGSVEYGLFTRAVASTGEELTLRIPLTIQRAIPPGHERTSIRIFPPTNVASRFALPAVIHPTGSFPLKMNVSGIAENGAKQGTRWRLCQMVWRIEEHEAVTSTPCVKHVHKVTSSTKSISHEEIRVIGRGEEKSGWKTDFDTAGGEITVELDASIRTGCNPVCNLSVPGGWQVDHSLAVELIIVEEFCPSRHVTPSPTGGARVLRMHFPIHVTERTGLGISWDEEMPPVYDDVPASPPGYSTIDTGSTTEYHGPPLAPLPDYAELEQMH